MLPLFLPMRLSLIQNKSVVNTQVVAADVATALVVATVIATAVHAVEVTRAAGTAVPETTLATTADGGRAHTSVVARLHTGVPLVRPTVVTKDALHAPSNSFRFLYTEGL